MKQYSLRQALLPERWLPRLDRLLPVDPARFIGVPVTRWIAFAYLVLITVRSGIHVLAPDGGAGSIATVDLSVTGASNIVAMFGQWGAIQLELAMLLWVLLIRYPGLTPLVLLVFAMEPCFRAFAGHLKPLVTLGVAPGAAFNWMVAPFLCGVLYLSLCSRRQ